MQRISTVYQVVKFTHFFFFYVNLWCTLLVCWNWTLGVSRWEKEKSIYLKIDICFFIPLSVSTAVNQCPVPRVAQNCFELVFFLLIYICFKRLDSAGPFYALFNTGRLSGKCFFICICLSILFFQNEDIILYFFFHQTLSSFLNFLMRVTCKPSIFVFNSF